MITCTRRIQFCVGHRVYGHESKCSNLHGHNYVVLFTARGVDEALDALGRVIDFSVLKEKLGGWIECHWDHGFVLWDEDQEAIDAVKSVGGQKLYLLPYNPTAENLADHLLGVSSGELHGTGVQVIEIEIWETENCKAVAYAAGQ